MLQDAVLRGADQLAQPEESFQTASAIQRSFQSFSFENSGDIREVLAPIPASAMGAKPIYSWDRLQGVVLSSHNILPPKTLIGETTDVESSLPPHFKNWPL